MSDEPRQAESGDASWKDDREYAWTYFALHAGQRMSTFNFFLVSAAILSAGLVQAAKEELHAVGVGLGFGLALCAFAFWKLDQRVRYLIKHAEGALKAIELRTSSSLARLFSHEERETGRRTAFTPWPRRWHLSYSRCFAIIYLLFGSFGLFMCVASCVALPSQPTAGVQPGQTRGADLGGTASRSEEASLSGSFEFLTSRSVARASLALGSALMACGRPVIPPAAVCRPDRGCPCAEDPRVRPSSK